MERLRILLVGDYDMNVTAHRANPLALQLAAEQAGCDVQGEWPGTEAIARDPSVLRDFDAVWCVPASPNANMEGALRAIRMARETGTPFLGTCGGFQHAIIEYARNVLGNADADHEESNPDSSTPLISRLTCSLVEVQGKIRIEPGSLAESWIGQSSVVEEYHCNFGLQADQENRFRDADLCFYRS